jgi:predicted metal-dependent phosphotriesterase family hydrolase
MARKKKPAITDDVGKLLRSYGLDTITETEFWDRMRRAGFTQATIDKFLDDERAKLDKERG